MRIALGFIVDDVAGADHRIEAQLAHDDIADHAPQ